MSKDLALAGVLGEFVADTTPEKVSPAALAEARIRLMDGLACAIAGAGNVTTKLAQKWASRMAFAGPSRAWFGGTRGSVQDCAFANSVFVHSILHEDSSVYGHPACNVIPSALAVGEAEKSTGTEVLTAIALGYEVQARISAKGNAYKNARATAIRWTAMLGIFGASVAAMRLMKLNSQQAKNAIAFCASFCAPGVEEPLNVGSYERCLQVGQLTRSGIFAAELAWAGIEGADRALDGDCGFYAAYLGTDAPVDAITNGLGVTWPSTVIDATYMYKPYPTAALNIGATWCAEKLFKDTKLSHKDVTKVLVRQSWWDRNVGYIYTGPFKTIEQALMSAPFAVATALVYGRYDWPTVENAFGNPDVDALAKKVLMHGVMGAGRKRYESASVDVTLSDGRQLSMASDSLPPGLVKLTWDEEVEKFLRMTAPNLDSKTQAAIIAEIRELEQRPDLSVLLDCLGKVKA